jgi:hypothetical protein
MKWIVLILATCVTISLAFGAMEIPQVPYNAIDPSEGPMYVTNLAVGLENLYVYMYTFSLDLEQFKDSYKANDPLFLEIYNPETQKWINTSIQGTKDLTKKQFNYRVNFANLGEPFIGSSKFRLVDAKGNAIKDTNGDAIEYAGPRIVVNLKDENYKRDSQGTYTYSVMARSDEQKTILIGLRGTLDKAKWDWVGTPQTVSSRGWTKLEWKNEPYYKVLEFKIYS